MSRFSVKKKGIVTATIICHEPASNGYKKQTFTADIQKLYGEEKEQFMSSLAGRSAVDVARQLVRKVDKIGWFVEEAGQPVNTLTGDDLDEFFQDMQQVPVDYVMSPLAQECIAAQDQDVRKVLEAKN